MEPLTYWYNHLIENLKDNRFGVTGFVMIFQTTLIVPATLFAILTGTQSLAHIIICGSMTFFLLVAILSVFPIKTIINIFIVSTAAHIILILINILL